MKSLRVDALGVAFVAVWSSAYVVGKLATDVMPPLTVTLWRFVLAGAVLAIVALILRERWPKGRELGALAIAGVPLFAVQFGGVYSSLAAGMPAGTVSLIVCSSPCWSPRSARLSGGSGSGHGAGSVSGSV